MANLDNSENVIQTPCARVRYVEPNYTNSIKMQGSRGVHNYEFANPLEDYSIFVNLKVEVRGREIRTDYTNNNQSWILNYYSQQGKESISFLQGSKYPNKEQNVYGKDVYSLTTDYDRHIYLQDIVKKNDAGKTVATDASTELFGIKTIDIQYNNWMVPEVTIKFTDIRGAALFAAEEASHYKEDAMGVGNVADTALEGSFFKCFFTMPYPKFTLCVKGFYGQPVAYELACSDFRASFNSSTGNFDATAKFIGYSYSFLGDVMMNALTAAPFSDYLGKKYWDANVGTRFTLKGTNGESVPMMTLGEFVTKVDSAIETASGMVASSPVAQESVNLSQDQENIANVRNAYNNYIKAVKDAVSKSAPTDSELAGFEYGNSYQGTIIVLLPNGNGKTFCDAISDDDPVNDAYKNLVEAAKNTAYANQISTMDPSKIQSQSIFKHANNKIIIPNNISKIAPPSVLNSLKKDIELSNKHVDKNNPQGLIGKYNLSYGWVFQDSDLASNLNDDQASNDTKIQENQEQISTEMNNAIADCLGFVPSIENITRMVMAHFETLTYMITMCAREIISSKRTMESLGVAEENITDVRLAKSDMVVPPFPKATKLVTEEGVEKNEETWIGDFPGYWAEKNLVNGILNGINEMAQIIQSEQPYQGSEGGSLTAVMKVPLSPLDLILDKNPYGDINFNDKSNFAGHLVLRMFGILGLSDKFKDDGVMEMGKAEAINFNDFFPNPSTEFKQWAVNDNIVQTVCDIVRASGNISVEEYGKEGKFAWENGHTNATKHSPLMFNWTLKEYTNEKHTFLPIQGSSFTKIASDLGAPDANHHYNQHPHNDIDYIITRPTVNSKGQSFSSNKLICIEANPDRFSTIVGNQDKDMPKMQASMLKECQYDTDTYKKCFDKTNYIISYQNSGTDGNEEASDSDNNDDSKKDEKKNNKEPQNFSDWASSYGKDGFDKFVADKSHNVKNFRILYIPGVNNDTYATVNADWTLFTQENYYALDINRKAFLFLKSLSYYVNYYTSIYDFILNKDKTFATVPLAAILYLGALCYFENKDNSQYEKYLNHKALSSLQRKDLTTIAPLDKIRFDVKYDLAKYFEKWVNEKYTKIDSYLSLKCDIHAFNEKMKSIHGFFNTSNSDIKEVMDTYLTGTEVIYECVDGDTHKKNGVVGIRMGLAPSSLGAIAAAELVLSPTTYVKTCNCTTNPTTSITIKDGETFLKGFFDKLKEIYSGGTSADTNTTDVETAEDCQTDPDIKIGVYRYLKLLYDKWIAGSVFENDFTMEKFFGRNPDSMSADDRYFYFIDSYYNKIGNKILVNVEKLKDQILGCEMSEGTTLLSFLSEMYAQSKCSFLCVQNFMDLSEENNMLSVFKPVSFMDMDPPKVTPNFIVMYPYESSSHLDLGESSEFEDDSFSISSGPSASNKFPEPLRSPEDSGYNIPAFGVSYGKMYQSYFKDISVSMENPMVTEQSIKAQFEIASMNNENQKNTGNTGSSSRSMITMGQDLFTIYSNQSFTCEIEMMGDAWIQPLMYFELLNVPMFKGTYLIEKVSHHIEAGNMTTHITGVRMANTTTKIKKGWFFLADPTQDGAENEENMENELADVTNDCDYAQFPVGEGVIAGLLFTQNGISALNVFEAANSSGSKAWYKVGDKGVNLGDGRGITAGPGLTGKYLKHGQTAQGLLLGFKDALKDFNDVVKRKTKGKSFSKKSLDCLLHMTYWGHADAANNKDDAALAQWLLNQCTPKNLKKWPGWEGYLKGWYWIITGKEPSFVRSDQKSRAKVGYDAYVNPNMELLKTLGYVTPPTANDTTQNKGKDKGIWQDFAYAVNQSAMATPACGLNVAEQPIDKNSGYFFDPSLPKGHSDKLGIVFDIILNTYYPYIQELWWVALNKNDVGGPNRIKVVASKKPNFGAVKVGMLINTGIGSDGKGKYKFTEEANAFKGVNENSNQTYRRSIVKFYSKNGRYKNSNTEGVYGKVVQSKIPKDDWTKLKPTACADLMNGATGGALGNADPNWQNAVIKMGKWYTQNVHIYDWTGQKRKRCELLGRDIRMDCSGFVTACLWMNGINVSMCNSGAIASGCGGKLQENGFKRIPYSDSALQNFDIYAKNGHVGIYGGKSLGYDWGAYRPDAQGKQDLPRNVGTPPAGGGFSVIWRKEK